MTLRRKLLLAAGALCAVAAAAIGVLWWQASSILDQLHAGDKGKIVAAVAPELGRAPKRPLISPPPQARAQTILAIGSDHRRSGQEGARSDTTMLVRIDPDKGRIRLLSIPRDLYVEIPGHGHDRVNEAFHRGGEKLLTRVVRDTFGVRIDHFVEIDFRGFKALADDLGGLWLPVDQRYFNENVGTLATNYANIDLAPGYQRLTGDQALAFARYRHDDSDLYRAARQQLVIRETLRQTLADKLDLLRLRRLARDFAAASTSDISSFRELWSLAKAVRGANGIERLIVPASDEVLYGADYLVASDAQLRTAVSWLLGVPRRAAPVRHEALAARSRRAAPELAPDGGRGRALLSTLVPRMRRCVPTALPPGFWWPDGAARSYTLAGHPAIALYATSGSGHSLLWTFTTWRDPPILDRPTSTMRLGGREVDLYRDGGTLRQVAWRIGATQAWLTNTLRSEVGARQLLALVRNCTVR